MVSIKRERAVFVVFAILIGFLLLTSILAENTGLKSPGATGDPSNNWTNGDNIIASDNVYTTSITEGDLLDTSNYSFVIPANSEIVGIEVRVEGLGG